MADVKEEAKYEQKATPLFHIECSCGRSFHAPEGTVCKHGQEEKVDG